MITWPSIQAMLTDRANNGLFDVVGAGAPTNGASGTGVNITGPGSLYYDTTNFVLYEQVGTLVAPVWVPWTLNDNTSTTSGTAQTTEYTLNSITIPANFLKGVRGVMVEAWGTSAANANSKTFKIYFGATALATAVTTANGKDYLAAMTVIRTGNSTQSGFGEIQVDTAVAPTMAVNGAVAETDTANITIALKTSTTGSTGLSGTGKGMAVSFLI